MTTTLFLINHCQLNVPPGTLLGRSNTDVRLSEDGLKLTGKIGDNLAFDISTRINRMVTPEAIFCAPYSWTKVSAEVIASKINYSRQVLAIDGLRDRDWGPYVGKEWNRVKPIINTDLQVENGVESGKDFHTRIMETVMHMMGRHFGSTVYAVVNPGFVRAMLHSVYKLLLSEAYSYNPRPGEIVVVRRECETLYDSPFEVSVDFDYGAHFQ
jgi:broad specificity phosphatase PhoE